MTDEPRPDQHDDPARPVPPSSVPTGASSTPGVPPLPPSAFPQAPSQQPGGAHPAAPGAPYATQPPAPYGTQPPAPYGSAPHGAVQPPWGGPGTPTTPARTLSALSLIAGVVGLASTLLTFGLTVVFAVAGIVLGHVASRREPASRGLWLAGLITGYVGVLATICLWVGLLAFWVAFAASSAGTFGP